MPTQEYTPRHPKIQAIQYLKGSQYNQNEVQSFLTLQTITPFQYEGDKLYVNSWSFTTHDYQRVEVEDGDYITSTPTLDISGKHKSIVQVVSPKVFTFYNQLCG